jgi:TRAP-type C4-dicarboxylate transport system permease small subunit
MSGLGAFLHRRAENVLAAMLGAMFVAFLLQIGFRYLTDWSTGWTSELSVMLWIWLVLFGAAFVTRESEEIRFDLIYGAAGRKAQRIMLLLASIGLIALYGLSLPGAADYVSFMKVEKSAYMKLRLDWVYCIYLVFIVAILARYLWLCWRAVFGPAPPAHDLPPDEMPEPRQ